MFAIPLAAAIVPALLLLFYFQSRDIYPEPPRVIWATFFLTILTIPLILAVAMPIGKVLPEMLRDPYSLGFAEAFLCAAIPEESFKFLVVWGYASRHREFNEPMDGIVYGVAASLGFATLENILYVGDGGLNVALMRAFTAVPGHAFTGAVMGYFVGRARFSSDAKGSLFGLALLVPIVLHGLYDFPLLAMKAVKKIVPPGQTPPIALGLVLLTLATLIYEGRLAIRLSRKLRAEQEGGAAPRPVIPTSGPGRPFSLLSWVLIIVGGLMATCGALLVLLLLVALVIEPGQKDAEKVAIGGAVMGLPPLLFGVLMFRSGIRRLNALSLPAASQSPVAP